MTALPACASVEQRKGLAQSRDRRVSLARSHRRRPLLRPPSRLACVCKYELEIWFWSRRSPFRRAQHPPIIRRQR